MIREGIHKDFIVSTCRGFVKLWWWSLAACFHVCRAAVARPLTFRFSNLLPVVGSLFVVMTVLGGCSLSGAVKGALSNGDPSKTYDLVLDRSAIKRARRLDTQMVVQLPAAVRALAGDNILVKPTPTEVTYFGGAVWGDRLPKLLQARMVEAIQVTGRFRAVSDGSDRINGDVTLSSTVEAFQVNVEGERGSAEVVIFAKLIHVGSGKVYASRRFTSVVATPSREVDAGVAALNEAMNVVLVELSRWAVKRGRLRIAS